MITAGSKCPSWCTSGPLCGGDHSSTPESDQWPGVTATAYPQERCPQVVPHPTWGECDGLRPAVVLWTNRAPHADDSSVDLTPDEAEALAAQLVAAATAARDG